MMQGSFALALHASEIFSLKDRTRDEDTESFTIDASNTTFVVFARAGTFDSDPAEHGTPAEFLVTSGGRRPVRIGFGSPEELLMYLESSHINKWNAGISSSTSPCVGWTDFVSQETLVLLAIDVLPEYGVSGCKPGDDFQIGRHRFYTEQLGEEGRILIEDAGSLSPLWLPVESKELSKHALMGAIDGRCPELGD